MVWNTKLIFVELMEKSIGRWICSALVAAGYATITIVKNQGMRKCIIAGTRVPYLLKNHIVNARNMKTEKFSIYLGKIRTYFKNVFSHMKEYKLNNNTDKTIGDKLRTLAAKADAIEEYYEKYCNEEKIDRLKAHKNKKWYNKHKNNLKKELMLLNYNY